MLVLEVETLLLQIPHAACQLASCANSIQSMGGIPYSYQVFSNVTFLFLLSTGRTSVTYLNQPVLHVRELSGQRAIDLGSERVHQQ